MVDVPSRSGALHVLEWDGPGTDAPTILFMHANGFNANTYKRILAPLAERFPIVVFDIRGHGKSTLPADPNEPRANWTTFRDDLLALIDALDRDQYILSGHSFGGTMALWATQSVPGNVTGIVMCDPVIIPVWAGRMVRLFNRVNLGHLLIPWIKGATNRRATFPSTEDMFTSFQGRGPFRNWSDDILTDYIADGARSMPDGQVTLTCAPAWEAAIYKAQVNDFWRHLDRVTCPVHVLWAEKDTTMHPFAARLLKRRVPHVTFERVPGASHLLPMEHPDLVQAAFQKVMD